MRIPTILALLALAAAAPIPAAAQEPASSAATAEREGAAAPAGPAATAEAPAAPRPFTATPLGATQPRTLRSFWHLFVAFAITWALVFGYTISIGRRFARLESDLRELRERGAPAS
jgi:CcmD family protein